MATSRAHREENIFAAALAHAPSYSAPEIWAVSENVFVGGHPVAEHLEIARARREYDLALQTLDEYRTMLVGGVRYVDGEDPRDYAMRVQRSGAPIRSVVNAWNLARLAQGMRTASVYESDRNTLIELAPDARLVDFLEARAA